MSQLSKTPRAFEGRLVLARRFGPERRRLPPPAICCLARLLPSDTENHWSDRMVSKKSASRLILSVALLAVAYLTGALAGTNLNGANLNGVSLNGTSFNGLMENGLKLDNGLKPVNGTRSVATGAPVPGMSESNGAVSDNGPHSGRQLDAEVDPATAPTERGQVLREAGQRSLTAPSDPPFRLPRLLVE